MLLVDACAGRRLADRLSQAGYDVNFVGDWGTSAADDENLHKALSQRRVVITRDKDFGTLAVRDKLSHCGIIRLVELPSEKELDLCIAALKRHVTDLTGGSLVTVEAHRMRVREPE
jgi:predicted nuclease of predicted toxin-antitoxin system